MKRFVITAVIDAIGLFVVTSVIPAIALQPYGGDSLWTRILSFVFVGAIFGLVNSIVAPIIKVVAFPIYLLTFGLISVVINGALLLFVAWLSSLFADKIFTIDGFTSEGLTVGSLGWAILGALIMSVFSIIAKSVSKKSRRGN